MEKLNRAQKMLNFGASKPRVKGGRAPSPHGSVPVVSTECFEFFYLGSKYNRIFLKTSLFDMYVQSLRSSEQKTKLKRGFKICKKLHNLNKFISSYFVHGHTENSREFKLQLKPTEVLNFLFLPNDFMSVRTCCFCSTETVIF